MKKRNHIRWAVLRACSNYDFLNNDPRVSFVRAWFALDMILVNLELLKEEES